MTNIRKANSGDLPLLLRWGRELYEVEKEFLPLLTYSASAAQSRYKKQINDPTFLFLIAELDGQPVGYLYAHLDKVEYVSTDSPQCEIEVIFLENKARGRGLSQELIRAAIDWAKENGAFEVKAGIFAQNVASQEAFKSAGFRLQHLTYTKTI